MRAEFIPVCVIIFYLWQIAGDAGHAMSTPYFIRLYS